MRACLIKSLLSGEAPDGELDGGEVSQSLASWSRLQKSADRLSVRCSLGTPPSDNRAFCSPSAMATKLSPPSTTWACSNPPEIALVYLAVMAARAKLLHGTAPSRRAKVPGSDSSRFADSNPANVWTSSRPTNLAKLPLRRSRFFPSLCGCRV